jgi:WD40 repeat protein
MYMAPELLAGKPASKQSDIYSLGVVLFQLIIGDLTKPLTTDWPEEISDPLLRDDLKRCFAGNPEQRFPSAAYLTVNLRSYAERLQELDELSERVAAREKDAFRKGALQKRSTAAVIVLTFSILAAVAYRNDRQAQIERSSAVRQEHEATLARKFSEQNQRRAEASDAKAARAEAGEAKAARFAYATEMELAQKAWDENDLGRLEVILDETAASPDRDFEWSYLQGQVHQTILTAGGDATAKLGDTNDLTRLVFNGNGSEYSAIAFSKDGRTLVAIRKGGTYPQKGGTYPQNSSRRIPRMSRSQGHAEVLDIAFGGVTVGTRIMPIDDWGSVSSLDLSRHGRAIFATSENVLSVVDSLADYPTLPASMRHAEQEQFHIAGTLGTISPNANRVAAVSTVDSDPKGHLRGIATVYDVLTGKQLFTCEGHTQPISAVAFAPDGMRIATGSADNTARLWDGVTGKLLHILQGHSNTIRALSFSNDGRKIATGSTDGTGKIWDASTGDGLAILRGHVGGLVSIRFSPKDNRIVTAGSDKSIRLWDSLSGRQLLAIRHFTNQIISAAFSVAGDKLLVGSLGGAEAGWGTNSQSNDQPVTAHTLAAPSTVQIAAWLREDGRRDSSEVQRRLADACLLNNRNQDAFEININLPRSRKDEGVSNLRFAVQLLWLADFKRQDAWCSELIKRESGVTNGLELARLATSCLINPYAKPDLHQHFAELLQKALPGNEETLREDIQLALGLAKYRLSQFEIAENHFKNAETSLDKSVQGPAFSLHAMALAHLGDIKQAKARLNQSEKLMNPSPHRGSLRPAIENYDQLAFWLIHAEAVETLAKLNAASKASR